MNKITLYYGTLDESQDYHWIPYGLVLLVAYLDLAQTEVIIIDERIEKENTIKLINKHVPGSLFFGISSFTGYQLSRSIETAKYVKKHFPNIPIVWGGSHVTALPEESLRENFVDIVVANRGESVLPHLIKGLTNNNLKNIPGVYLKENGHIHGIPNNDLGDFGATPDWPFDLLKIKEYLNPKTMILNLTTSWGCSNKCTFCYWYQKENPWSTFSAKRVYNIVRRFKEKYSIKKITFNEANYFLDLERSLEIARLLKPLELKYWATARADELSLLGVGDFKLLEDSGLRTIFIGLESGSPRVLKLMNKNINLDDLFTVARNSRKTNITLYLSLLFQIPNEQIEDVKITANYVNKLKNLNPNIRIQTCSFTPLPNLPLTRLAAKKGFKIPQNMHEWSTIVKKSRFERKPWLTDEYAREYKVIFNGLFPESQLMEYT